MSERVIKFRAWLPKERQFFPWGVGDIEGTGAYFTGPPSDPTAEHQQFTGLKDVKGKDIYEGDVLIVREVNKTIPYAVEVVFEDGGWELSNFPDNWPFVRRLSAWVEQCDIVGNIHEHPALLGTTERT